MGLREEFISKWERKENNEKEEEKRKSVWREEKLREKKWFLRDKSLRKIFERNLEAKE